MKSLVRPWTPSAATHCASFVNACSSFRKSVARSVRHLCLSTTQGPCRHAARDQRMHGRLHWHQHRHLTCTSVPLFASSRQPVRLCVQTELVAVPWDEIPDGLSTSPFPVAEEVAVRIGIASPLAVAFTVNVWISRPADSDPLLAGTISDSKPWLTVALLPGSVRFGLSIAEPIPAELAAAASVALPDGRMAELQYRQPRDAAAGARSWADDDTDPDELPSLEELKQAAEARRSRASGLAAFHSDKFDFGAMRVQPQEVVCDFILQRLGESRPVIASAVVANLGVDVALRLLHSAETIQADGGMLIEESGKKRTVGGVFIKLLRESTDLDQAYANAAWLGIKKDGDAARKAKLQERCQRRKYGERSPGDEQGKRLFISPRSIENRSPSKRKEKFGGVTPANLVSNFSTA
eukprot:scaffold2007_cov123-Isochrysis_galbana.AAC.2